MGSDMTLRHYLFAVMLGSLVCASTGCTAPIGSLPASATLQSSSPYFGRGSVSDGISFAFTTIDDQADPTFNEILGLNNEAKLAGFYGNGTTGHPNRGYTVYRPYQPNNFKNDNYPGSVETQVTCVNNKKTFAGFYVDRKGRTFGFAQIAGIWTSYKDPHARGGNPEVTELLGVNDSRVGVGFYKDSYGIDHAFQLNMVTGGFQDIRPPGADESVATGITGRGDIVGYLKSSSQTIGFLLRQGEFTELSYPRATETKFLGVTAHDEIVGSYIGNGATHGFLLTEPLFKNKRAWQKIDEPNAAETTVVTGINIHDDLVGYYVDGSGNTNGFLAMPAAPRDR